MRSPQAWRAVASGYAAVLPTAAFTPLELTGIRRLELPFAMPKFEQDETTIAIVWNPRLEEIRDNFKEVLKVFRECLAGSARTESSIGGAMKHQSSAEVKSVLLQAKKQTAASSKRVST